MNETWRSRARRLARGCGPWLSGAVVPWLSRRRKHLIAAGAVLAALGLGFLGYMKLVELGYLRYNKWDRRVRGTLRVGDPAPDVELTRYDGARLRLSSAWARRPAVLVFGSCT